VQGEEDARKLAAEGASRKFAESALKVAPAVAILPPPPPCPLEADLRKLVDGFVLCQHGFRDLSSGDLEDPERTWAEVIESHVYLREQPHLPRALLDAAGNYAGNPRLAALAQDVAGADLRLTEALAEFAIAHASADLAFRATVPGLFRLDPGLLSSSKSVPPMGFRPELAHASFCGMVPVGSGSFFDAPCREALVFVRDGSGKTFAVHAPRSDVAQFNTDCRKAYRRYGPVDARIGGAPSGSTFSEDAPQPIDLDDDVWTADDAYQPDCTLDRRQEHLQSSTQGLSPPRRAVESAQESDCLGGRRQLPRQASAAAVDSTPTRPEHGLRDRLLSPTNAVPEVVRKFYRKRIILKPGQLSITVNDMMQELKVHNNHAGFGRAGEYGQFGYDDPVAGKTLSPEGLAVRLGRWCPLASACPSLNRARHVWSVLACAQTDRPLRGSTVFGWQGVLAFVTFQYVRAVAAAALEGNADALAKPESLPYPGPGCSRSLKITNNAVKQPWDDNHTFTLRHKCEGLWPLWVLATLMIKGFIRIDGRLVFQDKELYGTAWILMFKLLGQWNHGIGQSQLARDYIFENIADVLKFAFISAEEANDKHSFEKCTVPLNLPKPCNPLPPHPGWSVF
jgi:hypothetical protein